MEERQNFILLLLQPKPQGGIYKSTGDKKRGALTYGGLETKQNHSIIKMRAKNISFKLNLKRKLNGSHSIKSRSKKIIKNLIIELYVSLNKENKSWRK